MSLRGVTPYLVIEGAASAIDWYRDVLDAVEVRREVGGAGRVAHAELRVGGSVLFLGEEHPHHEDILAPPRVGGTPVYLDLETDDVVGVFDRMVAAGATPIRQPTDPDLPLQTAKVRDPFGHVWLVSRSAEPTHPPG
jgi:PhnB protein